MVKNTKTSKKKSQLQQPDFNHSGSINNPINRVLSYKNFTNSDFDIFWKILSSLPLMDVTTWTINGTQGYGHH